MGIRKFLCFMVLISSLYAFQHGGNALHPLNPLPSPGDIYVYSSGAYVTRSNTIAVNSVSILAITTSQTAINIGDVFTVTMDVHNNGQAAVTITMAQLRFYIQGLTTTISATMPAGFFTPVPSVLPTIPAGATSQIVFTVNTTAVPAIYNSARYNPVIIDGQIAWSGGALSDHEWTSPTLFGSVYQYGSQVTASVDTSGPPVVTSIAVSPNPAGPGVVTVTFNFSEFMDTSLPPSTYFNAWAVLYPFTGGWVGNQVWVGTYTIPHGPATTWDGTAIVGIASATDNTGVTLSPVANVGSFVIDTTIPTATLSVANTANVGSPFPVRIVATEGLGATPNLEIHVSTNAGDVIRMVTFTSNVLGITWNGIVLIPPTTNPYTVATFNVTSPYRDLAGNTNNILLGQLTINIDLAIPYIVSVNFDNVPGYQDIIVSDKPYIDVFVYDYNGQGLDSHSVRVTIDGTLEYSGPVVFTQLALIPFPLYSFSFACPLELTKGTHQFSFGVADVTANQAIPYVISVEVFSRDLALVHDPVPYPNPFSPNGDGVRDTTQIVYQLTSPSDVYVYLYDMNGDLVWKRFITKGDEGGHAGINRVPWDGSASYANITLPNGVYICHIVVDDRGQKKTLGRTKIYILK